METKEKVLLFWSGGKNSAMALYDLKQNPNVEVVGLITTLDREKNRVRFHGIPDTLLLEQARLLKLPLQRIFLPENATNEEYIKQVSTILSMYAKRGIKTVVFGDINLSELRNFKEKMLADLGMKALFPLWNQDTREVAMRFLSTGHKALVTSVYGEKLGYNFLACDFNEEYIARLPEGIDPAGENGEFHTFVIFGPGFKMRVAFSKSIAVEEGPYLVSLIKEP
ncbi:MAG: diphthine--ammonia ligase [Bacteriovorax sp.]|nr:diphthine--ammonia ligase [Bacteriovorax sp.]